MSVRRKASTQAGQDWFLYSAMNDTTGYIWNRDEIQIILLQEIRDQLVRLNATLDCRNTRDIPVRLRAIERAIKARGAGRESGR